MFFGRFLFNNSAFLDVLFPDFKDQFLSQILQGNSASPWQSVL